MVAARGAIQSRRRKAGSVAGFPRTRQDFAPGRSDHKTEAWSGCIIISDRGKTLFSLETRGRPRFGVSSDGFFHTLAGVEACPVRERRPAVTDRRYSGKRHDLRRSVQVDQPLCSGSLEAGETPALPARCGYVDPPACFNIVAACFSTASVIRLPESMRASSSARSLRLSRYFATVMVRPPRSSFST